MSLERRLQESMERNATLVRPADDPLGRATARLRSTHRRRMTAVTIGLVLVAAGSVAGLTRIPRDDGRGSIDPGSSSPTPTGGEPASRQALAVAFGSRRAAAAVTEAGLALTLDGGATWRRLGFVEPWSGDLTFTGNQLVVAWDATDWIYVIRHPLTDCREPCSSVRILRTGRPGRVGYQGLWLSFVDESHGWLNVGLTLTETTSTAELYETTDGGATWRLVSKPPVGDIVFTDDRTGFLTSGFAAGSEDDRLFRTIDAGRTWQDITPATPAGCHRNEAGLSLPHFFDSRNGMFLSSLACEGSFEFNRTELMATSDGGTTWTRRSSLGLPHPASPGLLAAADPQTLVVQNDRTVFESTDGGRSFRAVAELDVIAFGFSFLDPGFGWTTVVRGDCTAKDCSDPPRLYVTFDRGRSLRAIDVFF